MSMGERTNKRDLTYSAWHRPENIRRYLGVSIAAKLLLIDIDWCEACCFCSAPLALIETQISNGPPKEARITARLARMAGIPAFSVSVVLAEDTREIAGFRVRQIMPASIEVQERTPSAYANFLWSLRSDHECEGTRNGQVAA